MRNLGAILGWVVTTDEHLDSGTGSMKNEFLEEIWCVREKLAARFNHNLHRRVVYLQKQQARHGARLVRAPGVDLLSPLRSD
jgi:hypothetical protein